MTILRTTICVMLVLAYSSVFAQDYGIRMNRPQKAGEKYELTASGSTSDHMTLSDQQQVLKENKSSISGKLEGIVTILETDEMMQEKKISLTIARCVMSVDGKTPENNILTRGTEVIAQLDNHQVTYLVNNKPVPQNVSEFLGLFINLREPGHTDDEVLGTKERKKVGDSWPMNSSLAAEDLMDEEMQVKEEDITGSTKLEKVVDVGGIKCLHLSGKMQINKMSMSLPEGFTVDSANITAEHSGDFPVDTSIGRLSEALAMKMVFVAKGKPSPDLPELKLSMEKSQSTEKKYRYLK